MSDEEEEAYQIPGLPAPLVQFTAKSDYLPEDLDEEPEDPEPESEERG